MAMMHLPLFRGQRVFDRRSAVKLYRIFAAEHGIVNLDASFWQMSCDEIASPAAMLHRTGGHAMPQSFHRRPCPPPMSPARWLDSVPLIPDFLFCCAKLVKLGNFWLRLSRDGTQKTFGSQNRELVFSGDPTRSCPTVVKGMSSRGARNCFIKRWFFERPKKQLSLRAKSERYRAARIAAGEGSKVSRAPTA